MSRLIPITKLSEYLAKPSRPAISDVRDRYLFLRSSTGTDHSSLVANDTQTTFVSEPMRVRSVEVAGVSGGTVTVQVKVNGADVFVDAARPVSDSAARSPHSQDAWIFPAGSVIQTVIEATSGAPTGTASTVIDMEPFILVPTTPEVKLEGRERLRVSKRRAARTFNESGTLAPETVGQRTTGALGSLGGRGGGDTRDGRTVSRRRPRILDPRRGL